MTAQKEDVVERDFNAGLDVASSAFDPLRALYAESLPINESSVRAFNNVAEFENFLKNPDMVRDKRAVEASASASSAAADGASNPAAAAKHRREVKNVLTRMENVQGPLSFLRRCVNERLRVCVVTRNYRRLRGSCRGYIVAFDKHWNLAMIDVDEEFNNPLYNAERKQETAAVAQIKKNQRRKLKATAAVKLPEHSTDRLSLSSDSLGPTAKPSDQVHELPGNVHSLASAAACSDDAIAAVAQSLAGFVLRESKLSMPKTLCRHVNQLFIRGDNVVSVSFAGS